jgi:DNA-binding transcriptional ArsR family regulator
VTIADLTFEALAEPSRRRLLDAVRDRELSVGDLVDLVGLSQPGVSRHLKILRDAGLVTVRLSAQRRLYRARADALVELEEWLEPYRRYWSIRLDALGQHLEATSPLEKKGVNQ